MVDTLNSTILIHCEKYVRILLIWLDLGYFKSITVLGCALIVLCLLLFYSVESMGLMLPCKHIPVIKDWSTKGHRAKTVYTPVTEMWKTFLSTKRMNNSMVWRSVFHAKLKCHSSPQGDGFRRLTEPLEGHEALRGCSYGRGFRELPSPSATGRLSTKGPCGDQEGGLRETPNLSASLVWDFQCP